MTSEEQREEQDETKAQAGEGQQSSAAKDDDLSARLAEAEREVDQFKRLAQRAQADLVNFRNRMRNEQEVMQARTIQRVATRFIEVADQLEKALEPEVTAGIESQWVSGVQAIYQNLINVLKSEGFERFDAHGEDFDPRRHDALLSSPSRDHAPNSVMRQLAAGYIRNGEVVRPAQVEIAAAPEPDSASAES